MNEVDTYKVAYIREKKARQLAEQLLADKTRELYDNNVDLKEVFSELNTTQAQLIQSERWRHSVNSLQV